MLLAELRAYYSRATRQENGAVWEGSAVEVTFQERRQFLALPRPTLSHICWQSQLPHAPAVLTWQQLKDTSLCHNKLSKIEALYAVLRMGAPDETLCVGYDEWKSTPPGQRDPLERYVYFSFPNGELGGLPQTPYLISCRSNLTAFNAAIQHYGRITKI